MQNLTNKTDKTTAKIGSVVNAWSAYKSAFQFKDIENTKFFIHN